MAINNRIGLTMSITDAISFVSGYWVGSREKQGIAARSKRLAVKYTIDILMNSRLKVDGLFFA